MPVRCFPTFLNLPDIPFPEFLNLPGVSLCIFGRIFRNLAESGRILPNSQISPCHIKSCRILPNIAESSQILSKPPKSCMTLQNLVVSFQIYPNRSNFPQLAQGLPESPGNSAIPKFWNFGISEFPGDSERQDNVCQDRGRLGAPPLLLEMLLSGNPFAAIFADMKGIR